MAWMSGSDGRRRGAASFAGGNEGKKALRTIVGKKIKMRRATTTMMPTVLERLRMQEPDGKARSLVNAGTWHAKRPSRSTAPRDASPACDGRKEIDAAQTSEHPGRKLTALRFQSTVEVVASSLERRFLIAF
jgi:hypothetical protein